MPTEGGGPAEGGEFHSQILAGDETPEEAKEKFKRLMKGFADLAWKECGKLKQHRDCFLEQRVNPFRECRETAQEIISAILAFENKFDEVAGIKVWR